MQIESAKSEDHHPRISVLYHFFHPDDVVSARIYGDFCKNLQARGWSVECNPSNRGYSDAKQCYRIRENWNGVEICRVWRPGFSQSSLMGRTLNAFWMIGAWSLIAFRRADRRPQVIVIGTDPVLSVLAGYFIKTVRPEIRLAHWCFDLYPEAALADGMLNEHSPLTRVLRSFLKSAYGVCDLVADLGNCMRKRIQFYQGNARSVTLVPWALQEPDAPAAADTRVRMKLFGDAKLGILYSGTFGRAHTCADFIQLAEKLRNEPVRFCFSVRGNQETSLRQAIETSNAKINISDFVPESELNTHLAAADIHLVSLHAHWSGIVVPSKFFGSLAVGRPVIFAGPRDSCIAKIILEHNVGWVLDGSSIDTVTAELKDLAPKDEKLRALQAHCHRVYQAHFSRKSTMDRWDSELRALLAST